MIRLATKQAIYQALIPVAYPWLYDLGKSPGPIQSEPFNDARQWQCKGDPTALLSARTCSRKPAPTPR